MSWLQKLLPPKIQRGSGPRKQVPEGLWTKCPACNAVLYSTDLEKNLNVCPKCGEHQRIGSRAPMRWWSPHFGQTLRFFSRSVL